MDIAAARRLIAPAVPGRGGTWADLGAGHGTFTLALAELLGTGGRVHAVDRDASAVAALRRLGPTPDTAAIVAHHADFTVTADLARLDLDALDGVLLANALHFVPAAGQTGILTDLAGRLRPGGRLVLVEYDDRPASRWVPAPVSFDRLGTLAPRSLSAFARVGTCRSAYGGAMYAAVAERRP